MKAKLVALALALAASSSGTYFLNWNTAEEDTTIPDSFGGLEAYDKSRCVVSVCNSTECITARNHLDDAGFPNALLRFIDCPFRIGDRARAEAADAGFVFSASPYQQIKLIAMRVAAQGGGFAFGIATKDNGWPIEAVATGVFPCAWKPNAGAACTLADGGNPGLQNTMQPGDWVGAGCVRKACVEVAGTPSAP